MLKRRLAFVLVLAPALFAQSPPQAVQGVYFDYAYGFAGDGFINPYFYAGGTLPPGLTWDGSGLGRLYGTPTEVGMWTFNLATCSGCGGAPQTIVVKSPCAIEAVGVRYFDAGGGPSETQQTFMLSPANCTWANGGKPDWITFSPSSSISGATVSFTASPNPTGQSRTAQVGAGTDTISIVQWATTAQFSDNTQYFDDWFDAINFARLRGVSAGCTPTMFCPYRTVTRGEAAVLLIRTLVGNTFTYTADPYFADVPASHTYFPYIQKMRDLGITAGCASAPLMYCPDDGLTREQSAVFIIRGTLGAGPFTWNPTPYFDDVPSTDMYFPWIQKMAELGIAPGCPTNLTAPRFYCVAATETRGYFAVYLLRGVAGQPTP